MNTEIYSVPKTIVELADTGESPVSASKFSLTSKVATVLGMYTEAKAVMTYRLATNPVHLG